MNTTYKGKLEKFYPKQQEKIDVRFQKITKLLGAKGEKQAHVILTQKRGIHSAEVTLNFLDHSLVACGESADQFAAIVEALDKLESQILKLRAKRRGIDKGAKTGFDEKAISALASVEQEPAPQVTSQKRVYRVNHFSDRKPMTLDEAILEMGHRGGYLVYRDASTEALSVLFRRADGNFDLIEG